MDVQSANHPGGGEPRLARDRSDLPALRLIDQEPTSEEIHLAALSRYPNELVALDTDVVGCHG